MGILHLDGSKMPFKLWIHSLFNFFSTAVNILLIAGGRQLQQCFCAHKICIVLNINSHNGTFQVLCRRWYIKRNGEYISVICWRPVANSFPHIYNAILLGLPHICPSAYYTYVTIYVYTAHNTPAPYYVPYVSYWVYSTKMQCYFTWGLRGGRLLVLDAYVFIGDRTQPLSLPPLISLSLCR